MPKKQRQKKAGFDKEKLGLLKKVEPFRILDEDSQMYLAEQAAFVTFLKDTFIIRQGEHPQNVVYILVSGENKILAGNGKKQPVVFGGIGVEEVFGVTAFSEEKYPVSVIAVENVQCLEIPIEALTSLMEKNAEFSSYFTLELCRLQRDLYKKAIQITRESDVEEDLPLRMKISEIMAAPAVTCRYEDNVQQVAEILSKNDVSSVIVTAPDGSPRGIITEKDLVKKVLSGTGIPGLSLQAGEIMSRKLVSLSPEDYFYQAFLLMARYSIKHIPVVKNGILEGIVTLRDLMSVRKSGILSIVSSIEAQTGIEGLAKAVKGIDRVLQVLITERAYASEICPLVTELYDRLTRRIILLAEKETEKELGPLPARYSWVNMGSSGRMEQYSRTDQDNGIIFEDLGSEKLNQAARDYFLILGEKVVSGLEQCGFQRCEGLVMANNPQWCHSLSGWRRMNEEWIKQLSPQYIRKMTIFLDFRHIYGDFSLASQLREFIAHLYRNAAPALHFLAEDDLRHRAPLNIFRQVITEKNEEHRGQINLKATACVHLVDGLRIFSLREGITKTSTFQRLEELKIRSVIKKDEVEFIETAYETLMGFRIRNAVEKMKRGKEPDNYINFPLLTKREKSMLRESFIVVNRLQNIIAKYFHVYPG